MALYDNKEVVRIKVKLCNGKLQPEYKKLCIDPQITSFDILQNLLARAFNIKDQFAISYLCTSGSEKDVYVSLLTDWDLDAAILDSSSPCLRLKVDLKPFEEGLADWDIVSTPVPSNESSVLSSVQNSLFGTISKTVSSVGKAIGLKSQNLLGAADESSSATSALSPRSGLSVKPALSDADFRKFLGPAGHLIQPVQFRLAVYAGGVESSLRQVVWRHLLNVYPANLTGKERFDHFKKKCTVYVKLRDSWRKSFGSSPWTSEEIRRVSSSVKKDVLRTDRRYPYFSGADDSANVVSLFNVLVTYALTHPAVSYCQGMSDLAAPLLVVEKDEGAAYVCFVALMRRLRGQFTMEGQGLSVKLRHLAMLVERQDPTFHAYLCSHGADDLFFTYRWLLLETKREFPLDDAMYALEVMWSTLPVDPPADRAEGLPLVDPEYEATKVPANHGPVSAYITMKSNRRRLSSDPAVTGLAASSLGTRNKALNAESKSPDYTACQGRSSADVTNDKSPFSINRLSYEMVELKPVRRQENLNDGDHFSEASVSAREMTDRVVEEDVERIKHTSRVEDCSTDKQSSNVVKSNEKNGITEQRFSSKPEQSKIVSDQKPETNAILVNDSNDQYKREDGRNTGYTVSDEQDGKRLAEILARRPIASNMAVSPCEEVIPSEFPAIRTSEMEELEKKSLSIDESVSSSCSADDSYAQSCESTVREREELETRVESKSIDNLKVSDMKLDNCKCTETCTDHAAGSGEVVTSVEMPGAPCQECAGSGLTDENLSETRNGDVGTVLPSITLALGSLAQSTAESDSDNSTPRNSDRTFTGDSSARNISNDLKPTGDASSCTGSSSTQEVFSSASSDNVTSSSEVFDDESSPGTGMKSPVAALRAAATGHRYSIDSADECTEVSQLLERTPPPLGSAPDKGPAATSIDFVRVARPSRLPPPTEFGGGNPFLMFLCLVLLLQHRDHIMANNMDYNDMAMHYDRQSRKHDVHRIMQQARTLYSAYLKDQEAHYSDADV